MKTKGTVIALNPAKWPYEGTTAVTIKLGDNTGMEHIIPGELELYMSGNERKAYPLGRQVEVTVQPVR